MSKLNLKHIYGPIDSWRLGKSLGIDLISQPQKVCSFNCLYCQLGPGGIITLERKIYVPTEEIRKELEAVSDISVDSIAFSGMGEPTLASNLGEVIGVVKGMRKEPVTVLTNSSLINIREVRDELSLADRVTVKLDAPTEEIFREINRPTEGVSLIKIIEGLKKFARHYAGELSLQIMFTELNQQTATLMSTLAQYIGVDEVEINTPMRRSPVEPLGKEVIQTIKDHFTSVKVKSVYDEKKKVKITPIDKTAAEKRHPS